MTGHSVQWACTHEPAIVCLGRHPFRASLLQRASWRSWIPCQGLLSVLPCVDLLQGSCMSNVCVSVCVCVCVCVCVPAHFEALCAPLFPSVCLHRTCFKKICAGLELAIHQVCTWVGVGGMFDKECVLCIFS